ncbi:hypothetical protein HOE31_02755 [bacterium]|jgi:UDP-N-acetylmuramoyl-tripeptide--D-alanyl-D-alanine ligase|nr:hypothetical protein [bacterium]MBT4121844.1 hypothetical protein [bacterium]MBT4335591.1 hypothetical protein [bacterium]MBT4495588.1 hypothetical protein [bacterium]MBT4764246.1 hypothetical protein [bacterium]
MKKILFKILKTLATKILKKYRPLVIGITGSVGKTSTKEAIYALLRGNFMVRRNIKNYNNEIGVPLTIIGSKSGNSNIFKWLGIFFKALKLIIKKDNDYPEMLVLEMGADKVGDIKYLVDMVPCDISVVTAVSKVHFEYFETLENIISEKGEIVKHLKTSHLAILNSDDPNVMKMKTMTKAKIVTYGLTDDSTFKASDIKLSFKENNIGTSFKLEIDGKVIPVFLNNVLGSIQVKAALAALAVGISLKVNLLELIDDFGKYKVPPGRTNLLKGIKNTLLIDDTYNSSPISSKAALNILKDVAIRGSGKKIAILGEMLELGSYTEAGHQEVGAKASESNIDTLICVGERSRDIVRGAKEQGMSEDNIFYFATNKEAGTFIQNRLHENDIVLIKGSQGARMEQITKELMAEPDKAKELLVRQTIDWQ